MKKSTFQETVQERWSRFGDRIAIEYGPKMITFREIDQRSNYIANWMLNNGIKKESFIGILIEDRIEIIIAIIGILKAGCIFVPLVSDFPAARLEEMIGNVDMRMILTDTSNMGRLKSEANPAKPVPGFDVVLMASLDQMHQTEASEWDVTPSGIQYNPDDKIYIYFTSGTTGKPKAILGKNKSLLHFIEWEIDTFAITEQFRVSQLITPAFDAFLRDIFVPLFSGGVLCIPPNLETLLHSHALTRWLETLDVDVIHCVPAVFRLLNSKSLEKDQLKRLKFILLSGEKINPTELTHWYDTIGDRVQLVNLYGATETTMIKSYYVIQPSDVSKERIPIGTAMRGCRIMVCDETMKICDPLVVGEIYIRTPFRTFGYYNDAPATAEKFIPNPLTGDPDDLLFKTGDLGKLLPDGNIDLLGRIDRQVKIRGIRIEPEGIENVLGQHPSVNEAIVIKIDTAPDSAVLVGYITGKEMDSAGETELKSYLSDRLPAYMVPDKLISIDQFPRKPNGKIDYDSLPGLYQDAVKRCHPPQNPLEEQLLELWLDVLKLEGKRPIGRDENFFELGGNSLNVMSLLSKIHREFNVRISLGQIFSHSTIADQAGIIRESLTEAYFAIDHVEEKAYYPLSSAQKRLFALQQIDPKATGFNVPLVVVLEGTLDRERLEETFKQLIQRHESLRTSFQLNENEPVQRVHKEVSFHLEYVELEESGDEESKREEAILNRFSRAFDLSIPPLFRIGLINVGPARHILMVDMHHIVTDGFSVGVLTRDFANLYSGHEQPGLKKQYKDYSEWQQNQFDTDYFRNQEAYWLNRFSGKLPILDLSTDFPRPAIQQFEGETIKRTIGEEWTQKIRALAVESGVTLYMVLLSIFTLLMSKYTNQYDIIVGTPVSGRRHVDLEAIVGMFVNVLLMRNTIDPGMSFDHFLAHVKQNTLQAFENQDYPIEQLAEKLAIKRDAGRNPLYEVIFALSTQDDNEFMLPGIRLKPFEHSWENIKTDLRLGVLDTNGPLTFTLTYCSSLFRKKTAEDMLQNYVEIIEQVVNDTAVKITDIRVSLRLATLNHHIFKEDSDAFHF
ncbi:MAG: amino acid adenylation domain-containing protein [Candidatus Omnitrophota bacterium]